MCRVGRLCELNVFPLLRKVLLRVHVVKEENFFNFKKKEENINFKILICLQMVIL